MSRLIAISNRVPSPTGDPTSGGLSVALKSALEDHSGIWLGWSGRTTETVAADIAFNKMPGFGLATIDLPEREFAGYYTQHANRGLWPLFHGRLDLASFEHSYYAQYRRVNRRFARALQTIARADDIVWVHDYHLIPLGKELRRLGVTAPIGFFLHTPFPALDTLTAFPWHHELLDQFSAYDLVGFQTANCLKNFRDAVGQIAPSPGSEDTQHLASRTPNTGHYPIGIDTKSFADLGRSSEVQHWPQRLKECIGNQTWAIGAERLDYTKGLPERFYAFETLFEQMPELVGRLTLIQIAAPSRESVEEYQDTQAKLETLSGHINARLGQVDWMPIRYLNRSFKHEQLAWLYRNSQIGVVTPLRDGMNMVAKEYIAAQDPSDPGVLVLSRFAGAAEELTDALIVNPYDRIEMAQAFRKAFEMPRAERQRRWEPMMDHLLRNDVHHWQRRFLNDLRKNRKPRASLAAVVA